MPPPAAPETAPGLAQGIEQSPWIEGLDDESLRTPGNSRLCRGPIVESRDHQHDANGMLGGDPVQQFQAIRIGHDHIQAHDVGTQREDAALGGGGRAGVADDLVLLALDHHAQHACASSRCRR